MIRFIYRSPQFEKQLESLRKVDKKAAQKADTIISKLIEGHGEHSENEIAVKYGKIKIRNCIKYDLGRGYRLITVIDGEYFILSFIGKHEMCNRWLENNKNPSLLLTKTQRKEIAGHESKTQADSGDTVDTETEFEDRCISDIDEKYLRLIFSGLANR
ncbi:hypothetical protein [Desulfobacterium sp. N47]|uniref:Uncharacterized protein n=1 Tax=uncultured Desulfobacterium sp. TaxID=201089 RepID=E1YCH1_9BACT|nr:hypothetical protein N47_G35890 [uncultured Desulfobacterium sp.]